MELDKLEKITTIIQQHPVRQAYLFGSQAHGMAGPLSDIDIAVLYTPEVDPDQAESKLFAALSQSLHTDNIDLINIATASPLLAHRAVLRGQLLFNQSAHDTAMLKTKILHAYEDTRHLRGIKQAAFI